jgi:DNA-binding protein YbaB
MFEKLNQLKKIKELQDSLKKEIIEVEKENIKVSVNGNLKIEEITLNLELEKERQEGLLKECINEAMQKIQRIAAEKMSQMGGFGM